MKVLVTGAAGFIGSHLVRKLLAEGCEVRAIDNFSTGLRWRLDAVKDNIDLIEGDICDPDACKRAVQGVDGILHQAAIPSVEELVSE